MPYEFHAFDSHLIDAGHFWCRSAGHPAFDENLFEAAITGNNNPDREAAIESLVNPQLAHIGIPVGQWVLLKITEDYIDYQGFPLTHGDFYISIDADALLNIDDSNLPTSTTTIYTQAAQDLAALLGIDEITPVTLVRMERLEREDDLNDEDENEDA